MTKQDAFSRRHPAVSIIYFSAVITLTSFIRHPVYITVSFFCALLYSLYLDSKKSVNLLFVFCLPVFLLTALINPLFNHRGLTILARFPSGNYLTLESIIYGVFSALLLITVILWFSSFSKIVTSDKIIWLFGRFSPSVALLISMTLRFVSEFRRRFSAVKKSRLALGKNTKNIRAIIRLREIISCFSTVLSWSLESSITTSDSMRSRGYASGKRTSYSLFIFQTGDLLSIICIVLLTAFTIIVYSFGHLEWHFYPLFSGSYDFIGITATVGYLLLCLVPLIDDGREGIKWRSLKSKI